MVADLTTSPQLACVIKTHVSDVSILGNATTATEVESPAACLNDAVTFVKTGQMSPTLGSRLYLVLAECC